MKRGRLSWFDRVNAAKQRAVLESIDAGVESAREIFDRLNLCRFTKLRTFRTFKTRRDHDRAARRQGRPRAATSKRVTLADAEDVLLNRLIEVLNAGSARGSVLHELRLLLVEIRKPRAEMGVKED